MARKPIYTAEEVRGSRRHCGRKSQLDLTPRACEHRGASFVPKDREQRYCSQACGVHSKRPRDRRPERRKLERSPYEQLIAETGELGFSAVGRKHGVSDNAVRKWIRWYDARRELERERGEAA
jgi:hypothetical protein